MRAIHLDSRPIPPHIIVFNSRPIMYESGYLYFEVAPWDRDEPVYLKVQSRSTFRAIHYWLRRISNWHNVGCVTHLYNAG